MTIATIALFAVLSGSPAIQAEAPRTETRTEVRVVTMAGPGEHGPGRLDADSDGVVTRDEFSAPMATAFDRMDADHDGRLTTEELAVSHGPGGPDGGSMMMHGGEGGDAEVFMFRRGGPEGGPPPGPGGHGERRVEVRRFGAAEGHGAMDTNNDGKVSEDEFLAPMRDAFRSMDADYDGSLDDNEEPHGPPLPPSAPPAPRAPAN